MLEENTLVYRVEKKKLKSKTIFVVLWGLESYQKSKLIKCIYVKIYVSSSAHLQIILQPRKLFINKVR